MRARAERDGVRGVAGARAVGVLVVRLLVLLVVLLATAAGREEIGVVLVLGFAER